MKGKWIVFAGLALLAICGCASSRQTAGSGIAENLANLGGTPATVLYLGHGSLRVVTGEGKVIYIDPYAGSQYDLAADLVLVTHGHNDHNKLELVQHRKEDCKVITHVEALAGGLHQTFDLGYVTVEAVEAENANHPITECVGYILTFGDGKTLYVSGDTSTTRQMSSLAQRQLDYAFFCCDGRFNMDMEEAARCAALVGARHSIPYHMAPGSDFDSERAQLFQAEGRIILPAGSELVIQ